MKLLFISLRDVGMKNSGGSKCTNRNYLSFCEVLGEENVEVLILSQYEENDFFGAALKRLNIFFGCFAGLSIKIINIIKRKSVSYDYVFIDASYLGMISYYLKRTGYKGKIICFFHNIEVNIMKQKAKIKPLNFWKIFPVYYNEKKAIQFSDRIIALTNRDREELIRIYGAKNIDIIPISLPDELTSITADSTKVPPTLLFIGDNWYANIHGLRWFIKNVLNHVNIKLQIVGRNMDEYKDLLFHPKIEFLGYVEDISSLITDADYILCPIFKGGGMKVKICEALMYGKNIIGTKEAFEGYELDFNETGVICDTKNEFIDAIENYCSLERQRFNVKSREYYLEKYSYFATLDKFRNLIN